MSTGIESVMHEDRIFEAPHDFAAKARINSLEAYKALCQEAEDDYAGFWAKRAREELTWHKPFTHALDESNAPFYKWFDESTKTINNKALTSNISTLTTGSAHGFEVGQTVVISSVDATFNGTHVITSVPTPTTFRYAKTATDVASTAVSPVGSAVRQRGYLAVSDFASQGSTSSYNVPGSDTYNPDEAIDFIIASTEDPTA